MSIRSEFHVVVSVMISTLKRCLVCLYFQLFVVGFVFYLRFLSLFAHSVVQHIVCCLFVLLFFVVLPVSLDCPFLIAPSVFSNVYLFCLSSSCVPYVAGFSGLSIFYCSFGIL